MDEVWQIMENQLFFLHHAYDARILQFVLMNNHFHLMCIFPKGNRAEAMNYFMRESSREIARRTKRINHIFGGPHYKCAIQNLNYYYHAYKYIYRNPVQAGLASRVEEYKYSTLAGLLGRIKMAIPMPEDQFLFSDVEGAIEWLNTCTPTEERDVISRGLKKRILEYSPKKSAQRIDHLEGPPMLRNYAVQTGKEGPAFCCL